MASHKNDDDKTGWSQATVTDVKTLGSVKLLRLKVAEKNFTFKPGQWVDFNIPGVSPFTGYSMASPPSWLTSSGILDLAIKYSDYAPTLWVHQKCKVGDVVHVRVGGSFFYTPPCGSGQADLLLLAAGIGINPLYSILQHCLERDNHGGKVALLYSARGIEELVFKDEITELARKNGFFTTKLFNSKVPGSETEGKYIKGGRITDCDVREALTALNKSTVQVFVCGPPQFLDHMEEICVLSGVDKRQIHYEKWW